jgi:hypothetical protein
MVRALRHRGKSRRALLCILIFISTAEISFAGDFTAGLSLPYLGQGLYQGNAVTLLNLSPFSLEYSALPWLGIRIAAITLFSLPAPAIIKEFWFVLELPLYPFASDNLPDEGFYIGPVAFSQLNDQDFGNYYWGIGLSAGYKVILGPFTIRSGLWAGYHQLFDMSLAVPEGSKAGIAIGLTLLEAGLIF